MIPAPNHPLNCICEWCCALTMAARTQEQRERLRLALLPTKPEERSVKRLFVPGVKRPCQYCAKRVLVKKDGKLWAHKCIPVVQWSASTSQSTMTSASVMRSNIYGAPDPQGR